MPACVRSVLNRVLPDSEVDKVDFRDYALIVKGSFGPRSTVYDFGWEMYVVPLSVVNECDQLYCLLDEDIIPPKLLSVLNEDRYKCEGMFPRVGSILRWAAQTQLGNLVVVGNQ